MHFLNKHTIPNIIAAMCITFMASACEDNDDKDASAVIERPALVTLNLQKYFDSTGASIQPKWSDSDNAILVIASSGEKATAKPIRPGQTSSLFLFTVNAPAEATVVSYYPVDAPVSVANNTVTLEIPSQQNGTISPLLVGRDHSAISSYEGCKINLTHYPSIIKANIARGNYQVAKVEIAGNNGEKIAGKINIDADSWQPNASDKTITYTPSQPLDCTLEAKSVIMQIAPVNLSKGYTITVTTTSGETFQAISTTPVKLESGKIFIADNASASQPQHLIIGGTNRVHIVNVDKCINSDYKAGLEWTWEAEAAAEALGLHPQRCSHIDDCKAVDNGNKILVTSSFGWCVLLDRSSKQVLFHATKCQNAHSAELLPGNRIVVACSEGETANHNQVRLYDASAPNELLYNAPLQSAHGVVWSEKNQRLYATGNNKLLIFSLQDWDTPAPKLKLEKTIITPQGSNHDLTLADANTLVVAGVSAYLFDINSETFTEMPHFAQSIQLKSVNYNPVTSELWYTDATVPEGSQSWSTHTLRYATATDASSTAATISITDMDVYKVRVLNW